MKKRDFVCLFLFTMIFNPLSGWAQQNNQDKEKDQDKTRYYVNAGYLTNIKKNDDCVKADAGGTIRIGLLTKNRLGFYIGYTIFKEYHKSFVGYDDEGYGFMGGIDYMFLRKQNTRFYAKLGLFSEQFKATYPNGMTDIESSLKPDFGLLININFINTYIGWQPSDPPHINIGVGFTL